jgi:hypothetical protein
MEVYAGIGGTGYLGAMHIAREWARFKRSSLEISVPRVPLDLGEYYRPLSRRRLTEFHLKLLRLGAAFTAKPRISIYNCHVDVSYGNGCFLPQIQRGFEYETSRAREIRVLNSLAYSSSYAAMLSFCSLYDSGHYFYDSSISESEHKLNKRINKRLPLSVRSLERRLAPVLPSPDTYLAQLDTPQTFLPTNTHQQASQAFSPKGVSAGAVSRKPTALPLRQ